MSNVFTPEEIKGYIFIDGKKVTYLKPNVRRNPVYNPKFEEPSESEVGKLFLDHWVLSMSKGNKSNDFE